MLLSILERYGLARKVGALSDRHRGRDPCTRVALSRSNPIMMLSSPASAPSMKSVPVSGGRHCFRARMPMIRTALSRLPSTTIFTMERPGSTLPRLLNQESYSGLYLSMLFIALSSAALRSTRWGNTQPACRSDLSRVDETTRTGGPASRAVLGRWIVVLVGLIVAWISLLGNAILTGCFLANKNYRFDADPDNRERRLAARWSRIRLPTDN